MAINLITTIVNIRAPGITIHRIPLFVWAILAQSVIIILCIPVLAGKINRWIQYKNILMNKNKYKNI